MRVTAQFCSKTRLGDEIAHHKLALRSELMALFGLDPGYKSNAYLICQYTYGFRFCVSGTPDDIPTWQKSNYFSLG